MAALAHFSAAIFTAPLGFAGPSGDASPLRANTSEWILMHVAERPGTGYRRGRGL